MPGMKEAPKFGEEIHDGDTGYTVVKINYVKREKKEGEEKTNERMPKPLLEK